jgi:hypothetical protein
MALNENRTRMPDTKRCLPGVFWFLVNCLALGTAALPFLAIERSMVHWGLQGYVLLTAAAAAFVSMWLLIAAAVLLEKGEATRAIPSSPRHGAGQPSAPRRGT